VETTSDDKESLFREGQQQSVIKTGEAHGYSQVLEGLNLVLKKLGRGYEDALGVSRFWHNELCMFHSNPLVPFSMVVAAMAGALPEITKTLYQMAQERFDIWHSVFTDIGTLQDLGDDAGFERRVEEFIDGEIRKKYHTVRKRSHKHKELSLSVQTEATAMIARADLYAGLRLKDSICGVIASRQADLGKQIERLQHLNSKISDVAVLMHGSASVKDAIAGSEAVSVKQQAHGKSFSDRLEEVDKLVDVLFSKSILRGVAHAEELLSVR